MKYSEKEGRYHRMYISLHGSPESSNRRNSHHKYIILIYIFIRVMASGTAIEKEKRWHAKCQHANRGREEEEKRKAEKEKKKHEKPQRLLTQPLGCGSNIMAASWDDISSSSMKLENNSCAHRTRCVNKTIMAEKEKGEKLFNIFEGKRRCLLWREISCVISALISYLSWQSWYLRRTWRTFSQGRSITLQRWRRKNNAIYLIQRKNSLFGAGSTLRISTYHISPT